MRRRLDLAATLVAAPEVLFLDEPTTGLDPRARNELWDVLDGLVAERRDDPADHAVPRGGRPPGRRHRRRRPRPRHRPRRRALAQARGRRRPAARRRAPTAGDLDDGRRDRRARRRRRGRRSTADAAASPRRPTAAPAPIAALAERARRRGIAVEDLGLRQPTLDDVFLTLTGAPAEARRRRRPPVADRDEDADDRQRAAARRPSRRSSDTWVIARRGLVHMRRQPEALADATIQPIMFVLLFAFVFGGAIDVPGGGSYQEFLMGGIFAQTIVFGCLRRGDRARLRPHERRDRPLPLAADPARGACSAATPSRA